MRVHLRIKTEIHTYNDDENNEKWLFYFSAVTAKLGSLAPPIRNSNLQGGSR